MVLETLAAISLVGNVIQFVDFSCKLLSKATSIHHSYAGSSSGLEDVETVSKELQQWCGKVASLCNGHDQLLASQNKSLMTLTLHCQTAATELLAAVDSLKAKNPKSKWDSFRAALATIWKEQQINEMERRLDSYRSQLTLELSLIQTNDRVKIFSLLEDLGERNSRLGVNLISQISRMKRDLHNAIDTLQRDLSNNRSWISDESSFSKAKSTRVESLERWKLATTLADCQSSISSIAISLVLLDSLDFEQRRFRHSRIHEAYPGTFEWVFSSKFESWLRSNDPVFWISGKPGSGKSTLMKYLADNSKTSAALSDWAGSDTLVVADYYFWINGSDLQRSQEGLFRALLYDILRRNPELIKHLLPEAWRSIEERLYSGCPLSSTFHTTTWTHASLVEACQRFSTSEEMTTKFCIFIDGLDEFDGDHEELIRTMRNLTTQNVKLCVASRPWNVFEDAFGSDMERKIYLQDLNRPDMQRYVEQKLTSQPNFRNLEVTQAKEIVEEIVEKSQGVFLWVYLVVRSLSEGLRNRDGLSLLQKRLQEFPSDLDKFFRHMFLSLEKVYRTHLSHMFQVALHANSPLSLIAYWFLDEMEDGLLKIETMPINSPRYQNISQMEEEMKVRINGRCKGLLEVTNSRVEVLHRTVKDFFETTEIWGMLLKWQHPDFDPDRAICNILLAELKCGHQFIPNLPNFSVQICDIVFNPEHESQEWLDEYTDIFEKTVMDQVQFRPAARRAELWRAIAHNACLALIVKFELRALAAGLAREKCLSGDAMSRIQELTEEKEKPIIKKKGERKVKERARSPETACAAKMEAANLPSTALDEKLSTTHPEKLQEPSRKIQRRTFGSLCRRILLCST